MHWLQRTLTTLALLALVAACRGGPSATASTRPTASLSPATQPPPLTTPVPETTPDDGEAPQATASPSGVTAVLRLWLPPEFTPDLSTNSGLIFADHIRAFEQAHPGVALELRTKVASGPGGLLNALTTGANVAPSVLPDVIALRRDDLIQAAAAGLVTPLEAYVSPDTLADFYPFAQSMGRAGGIWVGLPFAADARVLAYVTRTYPSPPLEWAELVTGTLVIPAAEPHALTLLNTYLAQGGTLVDEGGRPHLEQSVLADALEHFQALQAAGVLPLSTLDYADAAATWQVFRERRAVLAVTSAQRFLAEYFRVEGAAMTLLPTAGAPGLALTDGWSWAIVSVAPERHALAAALINWLLAPGQHAPWTEAKAVLPTRAATLAAWGTGRLAAQASDIVTHAQLQPSSITLGTVGPALRQALADVLSGRATPFAAAGVAAEAVGAEP
jgi:ABC-type glycerol-3-phosphate transport system substrate-binding protein